MKSLFLFSLLLVSCASAPVQPVAPKEDPIPSIIALGTDGHTDWRCQVETMNSSVVWVPCEFHNETSGPASACVKITFYDGVSLKPVVESRKVCSGLMSPHENKTNFGAFIKEKRHTLQACGELLDLCVMLVRPADEM